MLSSIQAEIVKGDFANDDFMVRQKKDVDVMWTGTGGDDVALVWDGYQVDSWFQVSQGLPHALILFCSGHFLILSISKTLLSSCRGSETQILNCFLKLLGLVGSGFKNKLV